MPADTLQFIQLFEFKDYVNTEAPPAFLTINGNSGVYTDISEYEGAMKFIFIGASTTSVCPIELRIWQSQDGIDVFGDPVWFTGTDLEATTFMDQLTVDSNSLEKYILAQIVHEGSTDEKVSLGVFMVGEKKYG